jgi:hypothetical protein
MKHSQCRNACLGLIYKAQLVAPALALLLGACASSSNAEPANDNRAPEVPTAIQVPGTTNKVHFHVFAVGVQIYTWNGTSWVFQAPEAVLFADAGVNGEVGIHYGGPTWKTESGSKVVGAAVANAPSPNPDSVPQLLVRAVSTEGPGILERTTYIQRVNTIGGKAPSNDGTAIGEEARVPYTAEYYFFRSTQ